MTACGASLRAHSRRFVFCTIAGIASLLFVETVTASNAAASLNNAATGDDLVVPRWLYLSTGGATIGASALLASFVTDRRFIAHIHGRQVDIELATVIRRGTTLVARLLGLLALLYIVVSGLTGPQIPTVSGAIILVFAGVRAGLTMVSYLIGNPWPVVNPWRSIASVLPSLNYRYPKQFGRWPTTVGFLLLIWIETTTPASTRPDYLALMVIGYSVITILGAVCFGSERWFNTVDPISVMFRFYGSVAPLRRTDDGVTIRPHGFRLPGSTLVDGFDDIAFVIALIWELTFTGFVTTEPGAAVIQVLAATGLPPLLIYATLFIGGYACFLGAYRFAANTSRRTVETYFTGKALAIRFAPPLLSIAAGYHLAHYFGFFISLSPSLLGVLTSPLSPPANPVVLTLPGWFEGLNIAFILAGHLLAIWLAHAAAYGTFASRLVAIRSQYPFIAIMVGYTVISLWLISLPTTSPAFL